MTKPIVVSGIQPSGKLHVGNYLGALKNFVDLQNSGKYECFFFIADYHALTEDFDPQAKRAEVFDLMATFLAAGLDPKKSTLFVQSRIPEHTELAWILDTITPMGELKRMTQLKDKVLPKIISEEEMTPEEMEMDVRERTIKKVREEVNKAFDSANAGLFTYPVLMAADILMYDASVVPTGNDQDQHLELTRTLARKFNSRFGNTFIEPKNLHTELPRVMALDDPKKKMSKSQPNGCLFIDDSPEVMKNKIMRAVTDSGRDIKLDLEKKPGITNLLRLAHALSGKGIVEFEQEFKGASYVDFKKAVGDIAAKQFAPFRAAKAKLVKNRKAVLAAFDAGTKKAEKIAAKKLEAVKTKIGLA